MYLHVYVYIYIYICVCVLNFSQSLTADPPISVNLNRILADHALSTRTVQARIIGFREHIFTGSHGAVGADRHRRGYKGVVIPFQCLVPTCISHPVAFLFGNRQSTWALFFALAWMNCAPISVYWVGLLFYTSVLPHESCWKSVIANKDSLRETLVECGYASWCQFFPLSESECKHSSL